jgi:hypothetical protein
MPKITLTADEEIQYLRELDRIQDMIPDLQIQIVSESLPYQGGYVLSDTSVGDEFRTFLRTNNLKQSGTTERVAR